MTTRHFVSRIAAAFVLAMLAIPGIAQAAAVASLKDSFSGASINSTVIWTTAQNQGAASESGGTLNLAPNANTGASKVFVQSNSTYVLTGSMAAIRAVTMPNSAGNVDTQFSLLLDGNNYLQWFWQNNTLYAFCVVAGVSTTVATLTYSPSAHAWWRIRENAGTTYWETSADGASYTVQGSVSTSKLFSLSSLRYYIYLETFNSGSASPGRASYSSLNVAPAGIPLLSTLSDSFGGTSLGTNWTLELQNQGSVTESGGSLNLTPNANTGSSFLAIRSARPYTLTGSAASVQAKQVVSNAVGVDGRFTMQIDSSNSVEWWFEQGSLYAFYTVNSVRTTGATLSYDATQHAWWRIRESGGTVYWETSANSVTWTSRASVVSSALFDLSLVQARFYTETWGSGSSSPGSAKYANFNSPSNPHFVVSGVQTPVTRGASTSVTVDVRDALGNRVTGYRGTASFTSSDPLATLPFTHTFTSADAGLYTASISFGTTGTQSIAVTDIATSSINGTQSSISVVSAPITPAISAASPVTSGANGWTALVNANPGMSYYWTISGGTITSSNGSAGLTSGNTNTITFSVSASAPGTVSLTCAESNSAGSSSVAGAQSVSVVAAPATPVIAGAAAVTAGTTGLVASVVAHGGMTYTWSIIGGMITSTGGANGQPVGSNNSITYLVTGPAGTTLTLSCLETNAAGTNSGAGTLNEAIDATPMAPNITAASPVTPGVSGLTASIAARSGMTYLWSVSGGALTSSSAGVLSGGVDSITYSAPALPGTITLSCIETNGAGVSSSPGTVYVTAQDVAPPTWPTGSALQFQHPSTTDILMSWPAATDNVGVTGYRVYQDGALIATLGASQLDCNLGGLQSGQNHALKVEAGDAAGNWSANGPFAQAATAAPDTALPPAPPVDPTVTTTLMTASSFLYSGSAAPQVGMAPGTIDSRRVSVVRGQVHDVSGNALAGVRVTILAHAELGHVYSRADGMFDLAVNGGGPLTVDYVKPGYLPVQRQLDTPWQDYVWCPDVTMTTLDVNQTAISVGSSSLQVARGNPTHDADGARQATVVFPSGTQATLQTATGSVAMTSLHVRATEYTVGAGGAKAMPASLPPASGYTYAISLTADEATVSGATSVVFNQPVYFYLENFVGFPVGGNVPAGYYDRINGNWVTSNNGVVLRVLSVTSGLAALDVSGGGTAATPAQLAALGITDTERQQLASLYASGQSLWRVPMTHFTDWDLNWGVSPPPDAVPPLFPSPKPPDLNLPCLQAGSIIECENQTLGEEIPVVGTPYALHYRSDRVPGRTAAYSLDIPLSLVSVPASLKYIELTITVAGQQTIIDLPPTAGQVYHFTWDGRDAYGRTLQGKQPINVKIAYAYPMVYSVVSNFGYNGNGTTIVASRSTSTFFFTGTRGATGGWTSMVGVWDARKQGIGGWTLDPHHSYDSTARTLYKGTGERVASAQLPLALLIEAKAVSPTAGSAPQEGAFATQIVCDYIPKDGGVIAPDGALYFPCGEQIWRVSADGRIHLFAGISQIPGPGGDGGAATQAHFTNLSSMAFGPDGSLFVIDLNVIRRIGPDGIISRFAGVVENGSYLFSGDGGPATQAQLSLNTGIAVGPEGAVYVSDTGNQRVRRVGTDGIITTIAGNPSVCTDYYYCGNSWVAGYSGDEGPATQSLLSSPRGLTFGPGGALYVSDSGNNVIRRISASGTITTVVGTQYQFSGTPAFAGDGGRATDATLCGPTDLVIAPDGSLFIDDYFNGRIRRVTPDGVISTVAGNGQKGSMGDGGPALSASFDALNSLTSSPDGSMVVGDRYRYRRIFSPANGYGVQDSLIASEDGSELYVFDGSGRHLRTVDTLSNAVLTQFGYDPSGRLASITDRDANVVTIERDGQGNPSAVVSAYGQRTALAVDSNGFLSSVVDPAGNTTLLVSSSGGLLTNFTDPRGNSHGLSYEPSSGYLIKDANPAGGWKQLTRAETATGRSVTVSTALGRASQYLVSNLGTGAMHRTSTNSSGFVTTSDIAPDGSSVTTTPDGTTESVTVVPDPRFLMRAPLATSTVTTPAGLVRTESQSRTVSLSNPNDPLSVAAATETSTLNGNTFTSTWSTAARAFSLSSPLGRQASATLDSAGHLSQLQKPGVALISFGYDSRGRPASVTQADRTYLFTYDASSNLATVTDPLSRVTILSSDLADRPYQVTLPDQTVVGASFDPNGNVRTFTPPSRPAHSFTYGFLDLLTDYTPPPLLGQDFTAHTDFNVDGQPSRLAQTAGDVVIPGYDSTGRLATVQAPSVNLTASYDSKTGALASLSDPSFGSLSYVHDGPLLTSATWAGTISGTVSRTYDANFRVSTESVNGTQFATMAYDNDGLLTSAGALTIRRDPATGFATGSTLGSVTDSRTYNQFGEEQTYSASAGSTVLYSVDDGTRDHLGRLVTKTETVQGVTHNYQYYYTTVGQLSDVYKDGVLISHYQYDANGNRLAAPGLSTTPVYDAQDRVLSYGSCSYAYQASGALLAKTCPNGATAYNYDAIGNLRAVTLPNGTAISYVIDGQNRRIGKKVNGALVEGFLYRNQLQPAAWLNADGSIRARLVYGLHGNVPEYMIKGGVTYRFVMDQLGSVRFVVDSTGNVAERIDYDEFGNVLNDTAPGTQPFGFAGGLRDIDTGLTRFGARDYDPAIGRWTAKDQSGFQGGLNVYDYAKGDPVNRIDVDGHNPVFIIVAVVGVVAAVYGIYKYIDSVNEMAKAADAVQQAQLARDIEYQKMMNGETVDPTKWDEADAAEKEFFKDVSQGYDHLPPGTSWTLPVGLLNKSKTLLCPR